MKSNSQLCEFFCDRVAHAYLLHLVATWRSPVYRYESGDIEVNQSFLAGLLDGYPKERMTDAYRAKLYSKMLMDISQVPMSGVVIFGGKVPQLTPRGLKYMNALVHEYGDMLEDIGIRNEHGTLDLPENFDSMFNGA